jgi:hypothetical protein
MKQKRADGIIIENIRYVEVDSTVRMNCSLEEERRNVSIQNREVGLRYMNRTADSEQVSWGAVFTCFLHKRLDSVKI